MLSKWMSVDVSTNENVWITPKLGCQVRQIIIAYANNVIAKNMCLGKDKRFCES